VKILVVGAGIAGSAIAFMLAGDGHDVRVVDSVAQPYHGGYQILLDRTALTVLGQLGAARVVNDLSAPAATITVVRAGKVITAIEATGYRSARRGDLVGAISRHVARSVPMRFGREVTGIEHTVRGVTARFADGAAEEYDLLIGADGLNSTVRRLAVEVDRSFVYDNGRLNLWVDVPGRVAGDTHAAILLGDRIGAQVFPYTDREETLVLTTLQVPEAQYEGRQLLPMAARLLRSSGPQYQAFVQPLLAAAEDRIRITRFAQVRAPIWHARNIVLVGDAAHCIDPLSGAGAHGGLLGAAILADELRRTPDDVPAAAARYTRRARAFVRPAQLLTAGLVERATASGSRQRLAADAALIGSAVLARRTSVPAHAYTLGQRTRTLPTASAS
jgi:2-polyprenyl-6-methoxyphenol hydroxylase-like FAD-dependent oxidoreductase